MTDGEPRLYEEPNDSTKYGSRAFNESKVMDHVVKKSLPKKERQPLISTGGSFIAEQKSSNSGIMIPRRINNKKVVGAPFNDAAKPIVYLKKLTEAR